MKLSEVLLTAILAAGSGTLHAQETALEGGPSGEQPDTPAETRDGQQGRSQTQLRQEVRTDNAPSDMSASHFQSIDQNGDGYLSRQEASADPQLTNIFLDVDENRDQQLSVEEFDAYAGTEDGVSD